MDIELPTMDGITALGRLRADPDTASIPVIAVTEEQTLMEDSPLRLSAGEMAEMAKHGVAREFRPRTMVLSEGDLSDSLYVILEGRVRVFVGDADGRELVLAILGPGEYFGELAYDGGARSASVLTMEPCRLLVAQGAEFGEFVARNPAFARHFITKLISQVRTLTANARSLALMDAYGRVARLLLENAVKKGGLHYVPERFTQAEIASRVGCSREMVSRTFKDLVAGRYISLEADRIVINRQPPARW